MALLICLVQIKAAFLRFSNITCESKDESLAKVNYCHLKTLGKGRNSFSLRYDMLYPVYRDIGFHLRLMVKGNGRWKPFLYEINIDMCKFWKSRYNSIAKMVFAFLNGHTNMNHSCPYSKDKYIAIDNVLNTEVSTKLHGLPLGKGFYALFTRWSTNNITRVETNIYFEIVST
ncbi:uncharacterized protein [Drosophila tropicalis]|uniref:uncharacterized protein n=1 Tax=Drosophila tropicalis TaxID=46794 RepID=UPI0035ABB575